MVIVESSALFTIPHNASAAGYANRNVTYKRIRYTVTKFTLDDVSYRNSEAIVKTILRFLKEESIFLVFQKTNHHHECCR